MRCVKCGDTRWTREGGCSEHHFDDYTGRCCDCNASVNNPRTTCYHRTMWPNPGPRKCRQVCSL